MTLLAAALALALPAAAVAQETPAAPAPAPAAPEKKQCRLYGQTGSIMPGKRVCHTKAEWASIDQANGTTARDMSDAARQSSRVNGQ